MKTSSPKLKSHYSPAAQVSLELPSDWVEQNYPSFTALYCSTALSQFNPHLGINRFNVTDPRPNMQHEAAQITPDRKLLGFDSLDFLDTLVDNHPAAIHTFCWQDQKLNIKVRQSFTFVQLPNDHLIQVVCSAHDWQWVRYRRVFEQAISSMRFLF